MRNGYKYKAFISYSHVDQKWAEWLHRSLERYRVPRYLVGRKTPSGPVPPRLTPIFRDRLDLASSPDLSGHIKSALENSENLLVICSPASAKSKWVNQEIEVFKTLGRSARIFCMIVDGDPVSTDTDIDCFPPALRSDTTVDGRLPTGVVELIAADVRKHCDGKVLAKHKLIAGLISIHLDDLRRREFHQNQRRMLSITASSLTATAFTIVLAVNAVVARDEADQRKEQAEDLLSFMVGDLRKSLTPIGRLDLLETVGKKAMTYFATVDVNRLTETELVRQVQVMTQLGEIRINQLQYDKALASFSEAYERSVILHRGNPTSTESLFRRSQAEFWVGFVHWKIGNLNDSRHWLTRYRDSVIELYSLDPSNDIWPHEVVSGHHNLAVLDQESGNLMAAAEGFRSEIQLLDELLERAPTAQLLRNRADALSWMGNISLAQGDMVRSRKYYHQSSIVYETLLEHDEQNATSLYDLAYAMQLLAETAAMMGDLEGAVRYCQQAQTFFDTLVDRDATNLNWRRASSKPNIVRGHILAAQGQWQDAAAIARSTITDLEDILEAGAADHNVRDSLAKAYRLDAWVQQSTGEIKPALVSIDQAVMNLGEIDKADRLNDERTGMLATLHIMRGEIHLATGDTTHTKIAWQAANSLLEDKVNTSKSPYLLDPWARLLILTGDQSKGRAISSAMVKRRYKPLVNWPSSSGS